jgi:hypothetical protein
LYHNTDDEQDARDLNGIIDDSLPDWPGLEGIVERIAARLDRR